MGKHFLNYWRPATAESERRLGKKLDHSASDQFSRVSQGDTLWVVSVVKGRLRLIGHFLVDDVVGHVEARRRLGDNIWKARFHALAAPGTAGDVVDVDLTKLVLRLRFVSRGNDRFRLRHGRVNAQQLQTMRQLTDESARLLGTVLGGRSPSSDEPEPRVPPQRLTVLRGADLDSAMQPKSTPRSQRQSNARSRRPEPIEAKAIGDHAESLVHEALVRGRLLRQTVTDISWVAKEGATPGWDIQCRERRSGRTLRLEVKGTTAARFQSFEVSANEWDAAREHRDGYFLVLVTGARTPTPRALPIRDPYGMLAAGRFDAAPASWRIDLLRMPRDSSRAPGRRV